MVTLTFKTNINCQNCIKKVTPYIENIQSIDYWEVNIGSEDKILEIEAKSDIADEVIEAIKKAGFEINRL